MSADDVQKQLDEAIANAKEHPLDDATQKKAMDELAGKVAGSNDDIIEEIKALAQYTLDIEKAMGEIDDIFRKLGDVSAGLKEDVQYLRDTWSGHINTYVGLLWESRRVAGAAEGAANDFAGDFITFLGEESTPMDEKKKEIANYLEKLANDEKQATTMSQGFSNLQKAVQDFQKDWKTIVDKYDLDDMNEQATKLQGEIDTLTTTLARSVSYALTVMTPLYDDTSFVLVSETRYVTNVCTPNRLINRNPRFKNLQSRLEFSLPRPPSPGRLDLSSPSFGLVPFSAYSVPVSVLSFSSRQRMPMTRPRLNSTRRRLS
ncbi:hypothetical protein K474DRAFT_981523 [Panus rudis PR-1116 ss-1]|nr:hypothetical protein K474DRAFT_981523 [Panus rudis PR-1116 ss-1]